MRHWISVTGVAGAVLFGHPVGAQKPDAVLSILPRIRIDSSTGLTTQLSWVTVSPSGVMAVANMERRTLQFFSPAGRFLGAFDGGAHGMKDMDATRLWNGETLIVHDPIGMVNYRINPDLVTARTTPDLSWHGTQIGPSLPPTAIEGGTRMVASPGKIFSEATFADGSVLTDADSAYLPPAVWAARPPNGHALVRVSSLGLFQGLVVWVPNGDCARAGVVSSLCAGPIRNRNSDGRPIAIVTTETTGLDSATYRVTVVTPNGDTVFSRRYNYSPVPLSGRDSSMEAIHPIAAYPPLAEVVVGRDGTIWLGAATRASPPATERRWVVLAPNGDAFGTASLPLNVALQDADRSTIWAMELGPRYPRGNGTPSRVRGGAVVVYKVVSGNIVQ